MFRQVTIFDEARLVQTPQGCVYLRRLFGCFLLDRFGRSPKFRADLNKIHNPRRLVRSGPFLDLSGGLAVYRADSLEDAQRIANADPGCRGGLFKADVRPWMIGGMNLDDERG